MNITFSIRKVKDMLSCLADNVGVEFSISDEEKEGLVGFLNQHSLFSELGDVKALGFSAFKKDLYESL